MLIYCPGGGEKQGRQEHMQRKRATKLEHRKFQVLCKIFPPHGCQLANMCKSKLPGMDMTGVDHLNKHSELDAFLQY
jgi:hypothetical protein